MMDPMLRLLRHLSLVVLVVGTVAACGTDGGGADSDESRASLEQQRTDVRTGTRAVVDALATTLGGTLRTQSGRYEGCRSAGEQAYASYRYAFRGRVDVAGPGADRPYLDRVADALGGTGFTDPERGERSGGTTLTAVAGEVELVLSELPDQGDYVLLDVTGPCVDTPTDDSDYWSSTRADTSIED